MKLAKDKVSFKIRLAAFEAGGGADFWLLSSDIYCDDVSVSVSKKAS